MTLKMRRLKSSDYYWAFTFCEIIWMIFAILSRTYDKNVGLPGLLFMFAGLLFMFKAFDIDHPGKLTQKMGEQ